MTGGAGSVRTSRGALVGVDQGDPLGRLVVFQYNPDEMTRRLRARAVEGDGGYGGARDEALRLTGAPIETISLGVELDAADATGPEQLTGPAAGVYPQLSALELLLYPKSSSVVSGSALALLGMVEMVPPQAPLTLLVWGSRRVLPVRLTSFSVTEQAYDAGLDPLRARVELELRVLSYSDLPPTSLGHHLFLAHQVGKEALARLGGAAGAARSGLGLAGTALAGGPW
ncbi:hypothetical protein [Microbispora sp. NPDC049125]|uniref:hypothetical protein n=1 Tax=Microbispora sp. NPDC049125 TaxID=3154929 RepID=UPI003466A497